MRWKWRFDQIRSFKSKGRERARIISELSPRTTIPLEVVSSGFFENAAKEDPQTEYSTVTNNRVYIYPSSVLFDTHRQSGLCALVIYQVLVHTSKQCMRQVMIIETWLSVTLDLLTDHGKKPYNTVHRRIDYEHENIKTTLRAGVVFISEQCQMCSGRDNKSSHVADVV